MKIAVTAWALTGNGSDLAAQAEIAEDMGFDGFWLPENHFGGAAAIPAPLMLLASVASRTRRIRLGTTSYLLPIRHPILAAEEVAVLDRISDGRVILGIGRGFQDSLFSAFDIPVRDKRKHFRANLDRMMAAWQGEPIHHHEGEDILLAPLPVQKPYPPLWVAAFGPLAIRQAGQLGLPYIASPVESLEELQRNIEQHQSEVAGAALPPVQEIPVMRTIFVSADRAQNQSVCNALRQEAGGRFRSADAAVEDWAIVGEPAFVRDQIERYRESLGMTYLIARGRIPGVSHTAQVESHRLLAELAG